MSRVGYNYRLFNWSMQSVFTYGIESLMDSRINYQDQFLGSLGIGYMLGNKYNTHSLAVF